MLYFHEFDTFSIVFSFEIEWYYFMPLMLFEYSPHSNISGIIVLQLH